MKNAVANPQRETQPARDNGSADRSYISPEVNIFETKEGFILEAEMPGVSKDGLEVTLEGNALTLIGHRKDGSAFAEKQPVYRESKPAHFRRVFELAPSIDAARINAQMEQGVLTLTLPKAEKVKPRKITVGE
jgi:HSP20 family protein